VFLVSTNASNATVYFVDASRPNNAGAGTSWSTAKKDLQEAINTASNKDTIWVKSGIYYPTKDITGNPSPLDNREKSFLLSKDSLKVYGGFAGTETLMSQRNIVTNVTTLSGDIGALGYNFDNSYHVVISSDQKAEAIFDGFYVTGGNANGSLSGSAGTGNLFQSVGGGVVILNSSGSFRHLNVFNNRADSSGGGIYNCRNITKITANTISNSVIRNNYALHGGGINIRQVTATIANVVLDSNSAGTGGGLYDDEYIGTTILNNVTFRSNQAISAIYPTAGHGGAIYNMYSQTERVINCVFIFNSSFIGGSDYYSETGHSFLLVGSSNNASDSGNTSFYNTAANFINLKSLNLATVFASPNNPAGSDGIWFTSDDGLKLTGCSPLVNAGITTTPALSQDILDSNRVGAYDIGAYEFTGTFALNVQINHSHDSLLASGTFISCQWYLNGSPISGATYTWYKPIQNGNYTVVVTDGSSCTVSSSAITISGVGVASAQSNTREFLVYPNPGTNWIKIQSPFQDQLQLIFHSIDGRMFKLHPVSGQINVSEIPDGIYIIQFIHSGGNWTYTTPFIKSAN